MSNPKCARQRLRCRMVLLKLAIKQRDLGWVAKHTAAIARLAVGR